MNKRINFEDTIYILDVRLRMVKDFLKLDTDTSVFFNQTMKDLEFINFVMETLVEKFLTNLKFLDRDAEADNILDIEWKFSQVLNEFSNNSSLFPPSYHAEMKAMLVKTRKDSIKRQRLIEESYVPQEQSLNESVVSNAELSGLLGVV